MNADRATDPLADLARLEGVPSAMSAARDAVDAVLRDRGRRSVTAEQSAAAMLAAARASAATEVDHGRTDHGQQGGDHDQRDWEAQTVRLYTELSDLAGLIRSAPGQAIARTHAVLARGVLPDDDLGRLRDEAGVAERMHGLNQLLTGSTEAPVIVVAGIAHAELITVAPFVVGNGIVARAVQHLILIDGDIDRPPVTVPEQADREAGQAYSAAIEGYRTGSLQGVRDWLLYVAASIARGAELSPLKPVR
jgi:hypothetical protein